LYSAVLSRQTRGVIIADANSKSAYFVGSTQLFFPRGGRYDLHLSNAEYVSSAGGHTYDYYGGATAGGGYYPMRRRAYYSAGESEMMKRMSAGINPVDVGEVEVPALSAGNLSFFHLAYSQHLELPPFVTAHIKQENDRMTGTITNNSRYPMTETTLIFSGNKIIVCPIRAGETLKVDEKILKAEDPNGPYAELASGRILLTATINDFAPGVQIGDQAPGGKITLIENLTQ